MAAFPVFSPLVLTSLAARARWTMDDIPWNEEWAPYLPAHIHRPGEHQVSVYVRINLGARRETEYSELARSSKFSGERLGMIIDAPGDVTALRRYMLYTMGSHLKGLAETDLRVLLGGRALEGDFPVGKYAFDKCTVFEMGLAAELAPEQACHNRRVESQARRKFMVRIPNIMRVPGQTFEGITADGQRVRGRVPAGGAPDGELIAFLTWGSWADDVVEHTGNMFRKFRARTREGYYSVGRDLKLELT